ncbi:MAG TPA: YdcF family protein [Candidatus Aquilonibacter sp.]|nr:YdcF family protein [Candidatus Aquilonibacter sp.]
MVGKLGILKAALLLGLLLTNYNAIPSANTTLKHFDTLIVLGTPCTLSGTPSPEQRERVLEGVRQFRAGVAAHIIVTGGAAHNRFVEADCMKRLAVQQGIPADAVIEENQAQDTIQNIWYSKQIMDAHHWCSAEIVSSPSHLPRTALILEHYTGLNAFAWRTHPSAWPPEFTRAQIVQHFAGEMKSCWRLTHQGFPHDRWLPNS